MKIIEVPQNSPEWIELRKGKITGSKLKDIVVKRGSSKKIGFYQLIADIVADEPDFQDPLERGHELEPEAIELFEKEKGLKIDRVGMCISEFNENIAVSPDGLIKDSKGVYNRAVEVKCLSSARHLKAYFEQKIPSEFIDQACQYFIVNDDLQVLDFVFYDPRVHNLKMFVVSVTRIQLEKTIYLLKEYQENVLTEVQECIEKLSF